MRTPGSNGARLAALTAIALGAGKLAIAAPVPSMPSGAPAQVIPKYPEPGAPAFGGPGSGGLGGGETVPPGDGGGWSDTGGYSGTDALEGLSASGLYDAVASASANSGVSIEALAGIGYLESNFQNVAEAGGTTSANGVWQLVDGTRNQYAAQLGLSNADFSDPAVQAQIAAAVIKDYSNTVAKSTGSPATVLQTYGAFVYGPTAGANLASAPPTDSLAKYIPATSIANNHMEGWTVGQFYEKFGNKLGDVANASVVAGV